MNKLLNKLLKRYREMSKNKGFTLIELVIVIVIIGILAMIMIPNITSYISKSTEAKAKANLRSVYTAVQIVHQTEGDYGDNYQAFMSAVADVAGMSEDEIGAYTVVLDDNKIYVYTKDGFYNYDGVNFGTGGIGE